MHKIECNSKTIIAKLYYKMNNENRIQYYHIPTNT